MSYAPPKAPPRDNFIAESIEDRTRAVREAKECLEAMRYEGFQLDGFNLLGVVANPRSGMLGSARHSSHGSFLGGGGTSSNPPTPSRENTNSQQTQQQQQEGVGAIAEEEAPDMFTDAVHSLELTLVQVAEQIETFNMFLEELSREYLGDDGGESLFLEYYYQEEEEQQIPIPPQLANLQLTELQSYLEKCGVLAHSLFAQGLETVSDAQAEDLDLNDIPAVFSEQDFDLTHPKIFVKLLLQEPNSIEDAENEAKKQKAPSNSLYQSTYDLVPLKEQDSLAGHLDKVELALQEQVRQKAGVFFQETNRFQQLQSSIEELLQQVQSMRKSIHQILSVYRQTKDISNHQRQDYEQFIELMDEAMSLIQCKASIGGLLSANDHLGAAQQIQYGRKLLKGQNNNGDNTSKAPLELQQLTSLSTCGQQFKQYESLVINNLSEELVDVFFHWRSTEKERVQEMVQALHLCHAISKTGELYHRRLQQMVRMTVRTTIAEFVESSGTGGSGVTGMTYPAFYNCLQLLIEELQSVLKMARAVDEFCLAESIFPDSEKRWTNEAMTTGADLATKSIAELLRLRKEAHSLITLDQMKQLWDTCLQFTLAVEAYGNNTKAVGLRSTLVGQAKAFMDRTHESNMSALVAALDSERWMQCEISAERQAALTRLCTGRAVAFSPSKRASYGDSADDNHNSHREKKPTADVEGVNYKVVWCCLLLVEMVMTNLSAASHFQSLAANYVAKVAELLRLFNTRTTHLVLGAGAIHSAARLKSINAKHLSMVTQCLGMMLSLLPHIRAALMAQLPLKQHTLLSDLDKIKKEYVDHSEKVLNKFVTIIGGIVEHGLAPRIANTDFDARARDLPMDTSDLACCVFLDGVSTNTRKMHQVLTALLPPDHLQDVFSRILAYVDEKIPTLFIAAASATNTPNGSPSFQFPTTDDGKRRLILEVECMMNKLNGLPGVLPWDFTAMTVLERKLDYELQRPSTQEEQPGEQAQEEQKENGAQTSTQDASEPEPSGTQNGQGPAESVAENGASETKPPVENGASAADEGKAQPSDG